MLSIAAKDAATLTPLYQQQTVKISKPEQIKLKVINLGTQNDVYCVFLSEWVNGKDV